MTREEQAAIINRAYANIERASETLAEPRQVEPSQGWRSWRREHAEPESPRIDVHELEARLADRIASAGQAQNAAFAQVRAETNATFSKVNKCLEAICDEAGEQTGKLQKQLNELKAANEE